MRSNFREYGYVTNEAEKLASSGANDTVRHRAMAAILQFVAQKAKPPRGRALSSLIDYLREKNSKRAFTVAGCNVIPAPGSKGDIIIICFSPDSPPPITNIASLHHSEQSLSAALPSPYTRAPPLSHMNLVRMDDPISDEHEASSILKAISVLARDIRTPRTAINEFRGLGLISDAGASLLKELASDASKDMGRQPHKKLEETSTVMWKSMPCECMKTSVSSGGSKHFMDRFVVSLPSRGREFMRLNAQSAVIEANAEPSARDCCPLKQAMSLWIRHFEEKDLVYLSQVARGTLDSKGKTGCNLHADVMANDSLWQEVMECRASKTAPSKCHTEAVTEQKGPATAAFSSHKPHHASGLLADVPHYSSDELRRGETCRRPWCDSQRFLKAREALLRLQTLPKLVRRGLPVLVTAQGLLVGMPSVGYGHCPFAPMTAVFYPRTPLGGGQASWF